MNKENIIVLILSYSILSYTHVIFAQDEYIKEFGSTMGETIDKGVVFVDGEYLSAPYTISRKGLSLYVNDREIRRPRRHVETPILTGDTVPSQLSEQERQKLFRSLEATRGIYEKYLKRDYGYLFSSEGGHVKLSPHTVAYKLPKVVTLLTSTQERDKKLSKLRPYNWHLHIDIESLIDNFSSSPQLMHRLSQQADKLLYVDECGTGEEIMVDQGFVFLNGEYVEAPYVLQRKGLGLFLNGRMVVAPPDRSRQVPAGDTDPKLPEDINSETSFFDEVAINYLTNKHVYLHRHFNPNKESEMIEQCIVELPFVTQTRKDQNRPHILHVTTTEGLTIPYSLIAHERRSPQDADSLIQSAGRRLDSMQKRLNKGSCYILSQNRAGGTALSNRTVQQKLPQLIKILRSTQSPETKKAEIKKLITIIKDNDIVELVSNYSESPQLNSRLEKFK